MKDRGYAFGPFICHYAMDKCYMKNEIVIIFQNMDIGKSLEAILMSLAAVLTSAQNLTFRAEVRKSMHTAVTPCFAS